MNIQKIINGTALTLALEGRLDTVSAPQLEETLRESLGGITELTFDFEGLEYISSAGLRVLLVAYKEMQGKGSMRLIHVNELVMEVLKVTGFADVLMAE